MTALDVLWSEALAAETIDDELQSALERALSLRFYGARALGASTVAHRFVLRQKDQVLLLRLTVDPHSGYVIQLVAAPGTTASPVMVEKLRAEVGWALRHVVSGEDHLPLEDEELARSAAEELDLQVGDRVVYPHHGAGEIVKRETKTILGEEREYVTIRILHNGMTVMVPVKSAGKAGLRPILDEVTVHGVMAVLEDRVTEMPLNWNRRYRANRDKIRRGDILELAEVVRNLAVRRRDKGLSTGEDQMLTRAKRILASELMYAMELDEDAALRVIDKAVASRWSDSLVDV